MHVHGGCKYSAYTPRCSPSNQLEIAFGEHDPRHTAKSLDSPPPCALMFVIAEALRNDFKYTVLQEDLSRQTANS